MKKLQAFILTWPSIKKITQCVSAKVAFIRVQKQNVLLSVGTFTILHLPNGLACVMSECPKV